MDLDRTDQIHVDAAVGWLGLNNPSEAAAELNKISRPNQKNPDVLEIRWDVLAKQKKWNAALDLAQALLKTAPDRCSGWLHQSFCLHELDRTLEAWTKLLPACEKFPKVATIPYNLACYACQLGNLDQARTWLEKAVAVKSRRDIQIMALADPDLKPLRDEIMRWKTSQRRLGGLWA